MAHFVTNWWEITNVVKVGHDLQKKKGTDNIMIENNYQD